MVRKVVLAYWVETEKMAATAKMVKADNLGVITPLMYGRKVRKLGFESRMTALKRYGVTRLLEEKMSKLKLAEVMAAMEETAATVEMVKTEL